MKKIGKNPKTRIFAVLVGVLGLSILMGYGNDTSIQHEMEIKVKTQTEQIDKQTKTIDYLQVTNSNLEETLTETEKELSTTLTKYNDVVKNLETLSKDSQETVKQLSEKEKLVEEKELTIEELQLKLIELEKANNTLQLEYEELKKAKTVSTAKELGSFNHELTKIGGSSSLSRQPKPYSGKVGVGTVIEMQATAYNINCKGCIGITKTGVDVRKTTKNIIAVDPRIIPLGSKVEMVVDGQSYGVFYAEDTGGAIKGQIIDVLFPPNADLSKWGRRLVEIKVLSVGTWGK